MDATVVMTNANVASKESIFIFAFEINFLRFAFIMKPPFFILINTITNDVKKKEIVIKGILYVIFSQKIYKILSKVALYIDLVLKTNE